MKKILRTILYLSSVSLFIDCNAQNTSLVKTNETIVKYNFDIPISKGNNVLYPIGFSNHSIVFLFREYKDWNVQLYAFDEYGNKFSKPIVHIPKSRQLWSFNALDSIIFFRELFFEINGNDDGFSLLKLKYQNQTIILDTVYYSDKRIHSSFSSDGKKLVVNTLNTLSDYYNSEQDDRFAIYSLENIKEGIVTREYIPCEHCSGGHIIGDYMFFEKSILRDDFSGGFLWKNIYKAPLNDLRDTVRIASFSNILAVTPDGKYILAERYCDSPKGSCAVIDVESKKYQFLLGREYSDATAFYSYKEKKFAFDFEGRIVYVDFPEEYPFDALQKYNPNIPDSFEEDFYNRFLHEPFK